MSNLQLSILLVVKIAIIGIGLLLFYSGEIFLLVPSLLIILIDTIAVVILFRAGCIGPLVAFLFVAFTLPFVHLFPYLWFDFVNSNPLILWGRLATNPYQLEEGVIRLTSMMAAIGTSSFVLGIASSIVMIRTKFGVVQNGHLQLSDIKTLSMLPFLVWISLAITLSWLFAPSLTIFEVPHGSSLSALSGANFGSAWFISYAVLIFAICDSLMEKSADIRKMKLIFVVVALLVIVIWFQLLRGDRESLTLAIAVFLIFSVWGKQLRDPSRGLAHTKSISLVIVFSVVMVVFAKFVGELRYIVSDVRTFSDMAQLLRQLAGVGALNIDTFIAGTWTAVLLSPLSIAGDYYYGLSDLKYGSTYIDYVLSIPPGFVADALDYVRPIEATRGPAHEMRYGIGGTHALVVPFMNFSLFGIVIVVFVWSYIIDWIESKIARKVSVSSIALLGILATVIPHWMWYGEKYIMNAVIVWLGLSFLYRLRFSKKVSTEHIQ